jgi:hypothetical protein
MEPPQLFPPPLIHRPDGGDFAQKTGKKMPFLAFRREIFIILLYNDKIIFV